MAANSRGININGYEDIGFYSSKAGGKLICQRIKNSLINKHERKIIQTNCN